MAQAVATRRRVTKAVEASTVTLAPADTDPTLCRLREEKARAAAELKAAWTEAAKAAKTHPKAAGLLAFVPPRTVRLADAERDALAILSAIAQRRRELEEGR